MPNFSLIGKGVTGKKKEEKGVRRKMGLKGKKGQGDEVDVGKGEGEGDGSCRKLPKPTILLNFQVWGSCIHPPSPIWHTSTGCAVLFHAIFYHD